LKKAESALLTCRGRVVGFILPAPGGALSLEIKMDLFEALTREIQTMMRARSISEQAILADFEKARKARRR
jgi:hypothetical protein